MYICTAITTFSTCRATQYCPFNSEIDGLKTTDVVTMLECSACHNAMQQHIRGICNYYLHHCVSLLVRKFGTKLATVHK